MCPLYDSPLKTPRKFGPNRKKDSYVNRLYLSLGLLALSVAAPAASIGNGAPNQSGGSDLNAYLEADDFTLATAQDLTAIRFWALRGAPGDYAGSISWSILSALPGSVVASGSANPTIATTGNSTLGLEEIQLDFAVSVLNLAAGTYWLVLHNGPENATPAGDFHWAWSNGTAGNSQSSDLQAPGWVGNHAELAFEITTQDPAAVPEPGTVGLIGAGLALVGWLRRRA